MKKRSVPLYVALSALTCGLFMAWWAFSVEKDTRQALRAHGVTPWRTPKRILLLSLPTLGIYWFYAMGDEIADLGAAVEGREARVPWGIVYAVMAALGGIFGIYACPVAMQVELNRLADADGVQGDVAETSIRDVQEP